jgi:hypothetical protein
MTSDPNHPLAPSPISPAPAPAISTAMPITAPQPKRRPVPRKLRTAMGMIERGTTHTAAAKKVGWSREWLERQLSRYRVDVQEAAARAVARGALRAAGRLNELHDSGSEKVSLDAAKFSLGVAGIAPASTPQVNVNIDVKAGYVIDLSEPGQPAAKIVGGVAKVIDAKPVE